MALMCRLYGEATCILFKDDWVLVGLIVITNGSVFNWAAILSLAMKRAIEKAKKPTTEILPTFYMASYLLDIVCANNSFPGLNWNWNIAGSPIYVYCLGLWENKYKRNYAQFCNYFFAPSYRLIFCK
jgi:hypothetical protein